MHNLLTIGADPEFFLEKEGIIDSCAGKLGFSKYNKYDTGKGVRFQEDNVLLEFDIDPCSSFLEFDKLMSAGIDMSKDLAKSIGMGLSVNASSNKFDKEFLKGLPKSALEFGCDPDYDASTMMANKAPESSTQWRTAGGHVHIGFRDFLGIECPTELHKSQQFAGVLCDYYLGLPSVLEDPDEDRKSLYGKSSCIRFKEYGIEYRTLSNYWAASSNSRLDIWERVELVVQALKNDSLMEIMNTIPLEEVKRVIDSNDKYSAEEYLKVMESFK